MAVSVTLAVKGMTTTSPLRFVVSNFVDCLLGQSPHKSMTNITFFYCGSLFHMQKKKKKKKILIKNKEIKKINYNKMNRLCLGTTSIQVGHLWNQTSREGNTGNSRNAHPL